MKQWLEKRDMQKTGSTYPKRAPIHERKKPEQSSGFFSIGEPMLMSSKEA